MTTLITHILWAGVGVLAFVVTVPANAQFVETCTGTEIDITDDLLTSSPVRPGDDGSFE
jgi:hypothetical protein